MILIIPSENEKFLYYFFYISKLDRILNGKRNLPLKLIGHAYVEYGDTYCVVKTLKFRNDLSLLMKYDVLVEFEKYINKILTPLDICTDKKLWTYFLNKNSKL